MSDDEGKLLIPLQVEGVDHIEIGGDTDGFKLYLERDDSSGVAISLTPREREAIRDRFMVKDRPDPLDDEVVE